MDSPSQRASDAHEKSVRNSIQEANEIDVAATPKHLRRGIYVKLRSHCDDYCGKTKLFTAIFHIKLLH